MAKTAVVDIDNTLWQFCDALYDELKKINEHFPPPVGWTDWNLWERYCTKNEFFGAINTIHSNQDSKRYLPYPDASEFLLTLRESGYRITIASHRSPDYRSQTETWLARHGLIYDDLHLSYHKTQLFDMFTSVVIDDAPQVLEKAIENGAMAIGLSFPWNEVYSGNGFKFFNSLTNILSHILSK